MINTQYFDEYRENLISFAEVTKGDKLSKLFIRAELEQLTKDVDLNLTAVVLPASDLLSKKLMGVNLNESFSVQNAETREIFQKNSQNFNNVYLRSNFRSMEDAIESAIFSRLISQLGTGHIKQVGSTNIHSLAISSSILLNMFRSDFEEMTGVNSGSFANETKLVSIPEILSTDM